MQRDDELILQKVQYMQEYGEIYIEAGILRRPYLSPYCDLALTPPGNIRHEKELK
jgi:hypothetical protein